MVIQGNQVVERTILESQNKLTNNLEDASNEMGQSEAGLTNKLKMMLEGGPSSTFENEFANNLDEVLRISSLSAPWSIKSKATQSYFAVGTWNGVMLIYKVVGSAIRFVQKFYLKQRKTIKSIAVSQKGEALIVRAGSDGAEIYVAGQESSVDSSPQELISMWGNGVMHRGPIHSLSMPAVHQLLATAGSDQTVKVWSFSKKERRILFSQKMKTPVYGAVFHPNGLILAINMGNEIRLYSRLVDGLFEITSLKTSSKCRQLEYSYEGDFLVSCQGNIIVYYDPFTLRMTGYLDTADCNNLISQFKVSSDGKHMVLVTAQSGVFWVPIALSVNKSISALQCAHTQSEPYLCFCFDNHVSQTSSSASQGSSPTEGANLISSPPPPTNLFIGFCRNKYMAIYENSGQKLIVEFAANECFIIEAFIDGDLLIAITNRGSARVYRWPIAQGLLQLQKVPSSQHQVRLKSPKYEEYFFWPSETPIYNGRLLSATNQIVITTESGIVGVAEIRRTKNGKPLFEEVAQATKRLLTLLRETYFNMRIQSSKRNNLIEKAQGQISKSEAQIARQQSLLEKSVSGQIVQLDNDFESKTRQQKQSDTKYFQQEDQSMQELRRELTALQEQFKRETASSKMGLTEKETFEIGRIQEIKQKISKSSNLHKEDIKKLMNEYKAHIQRIKSQYSDKIKLLQNQFEKLIKNSALQDIATLHLEQGKQVWSQDVEIAQKRVEESQASVKRFEDQLSQLKIALERAQKDDRALEQRFAIEMEKHNKIRLENLLLHSQVLKIRNQLMERRQILSNKEGIVTTAYRQNNKLENFQQMVKGQLKEQLEEKEQAYQLLQDKDAELASIFAQLMDEIKRSDENKRELQQLESFNKIAEQRLSESEEGIVVAIKKLRQMAKMLQLDGLNSQSSEKKIYLEQEALLSSTGFLKKRLDMEFVRQKRNTTLKRSALSQILRQSKNLLEECNQLRIYEIEYNNEIRDMRQKLMQNERMRGTVAKVNKQRDDLKQQTDQLNKIGAMIRQQLEETESAISSEQPA